MQRHVFSNLVEFGLIDEYNPLEIKDSLGLFRRGDRAQIPLLNKYFKDHRNERTLISLESLIGWNPAIWKERLAMNREAFPRDTTILITIREPGSFMRSCFQQKWHSGHIVPPEDYFLSHKDYDRARLTARYQIDEIFGVDDMNYRQIISDYANAFPKVVVVPTKKVNDLQFLNEIGLSPSAEQIEQLQEKIVRGSRENRAFSQTAMKLTQSRERFLNGLGLKSLSSLDHDHRKRFLSRQTKLSHPSLLTRVVRRGLTLFRLPRWRWLMHNVVDRIWPYKPYSLPPEIVRGRHFSENRRFVEEVQSLPQGIAVFER
ncbi:hypothetical protein [Shimia aestuarii]|uniref:Sulfotransferase family protein n=1 Tax=Shimia aestuarii TaxID=254406 RepID=A0A1I4M0D2_9RHOB|nr:hypothetical protein [Shimia aestuarii]SFL96669.1 hypothetical protein SAMN04488042_102319 [Shimia aestuarii]